MVSTLAKRRVLERSLSRNELRKLRQYFSQRKSNWVQRDRHVMDFLVNTGVRPEVLMRLSVDDARLAIKDKRLHVPALKGGNEYDLYLNAAAQAALRGLISVRKRAGLPVHGQTQLLCSQRGSGLNLRTLQIRFKDHGRKAGINIELSPYWFRHTFGKFFIDSTKAANPISATAHVMGHRSIKSTLVYLLPTPEEIGEDLERMGA